MSYYGDFGDQKPAAAPEETNPNDRFDNQFAVLVPSGNSKAQKGLPPAGHFHVNHFICHFKVKGASYTDAQGKKTAARLTFHFLRHFCFIFSENNIARAQFGPRGKSAFTGSKTVEFTIGSNAGTAEHRAMGFFHPDWVAMTSVPPVSITDLDDVKVTELASFHGDTLRRKWSTAIELTILKALASAPSGFTRYLAPAILPFPFGLLFSFLNEGKLDHAKTFLYYNRHHFLAGTRSWRVGYDTEEKEFFVETITIERYSCWFYVEMEKHHDTRQDILDLWDNLLNNFIETKIMRGYRFEAVPPPDIYRQSGYATSTVMDHIRHHSWKCPATPTKAQPYPLLDPYEARLPVPTVMALKAHAGLAAHMNLKK
jgi:hypothetical protein